jgi:pimeloyl-ACP methyl ester carboxylesterase
MIVSLGEKRLFVARGGGEKRALLFIHGAGMDRTVWALQARALARRGVPVFAFDLPGHGRSFGPALASIEAMAAMVTDLVAALRLGRVVLAGHSMGALIALEAASLLGARAAGLALFGVTPSMAVHPEAPPAAAIPSPSRSWSNGPSAAPPRSAPKA